MLTRALLLSSGWFVISFLVTLLGGTRLRRRNAWLSILLLIVELALGDVWAYLTFGIPVEIEALTIIAFLMGLFWIGVLPNWNAFGQTAWNFTLLTTILFLLYTFFLAAFTPLNPISYLLAMVFFFLELVALTLALSHAYESLDATTRVNWKRKFKQVEHVPGYTPKVSLHVPAYNEPPEVVEKTLNALARLDYPNYEVLVIDNNTPNEKVWRSLEGITRKFGGHFRFFHLEHWPGYKSGALNFALSQTAPEAEIVAVIDADYQVEPNFLKDLVSAFADSRLAFLQTPQDYRDQSDNTFTASIYPSYKYFFEVSMPVRNEHNAIIFCGTMGLIRKSVLQEIGGWDEQVITEDAEASLRILQRGYESIYINQVYGHGLMPYTFEGLKKQRFRWAFGGIQILRKHWEALMPWSRQIDPANQLSASQKYYYLAGGLQWFTDLLNLLFAFFLLLGAISSLLGQHFLIHPLSAPLLVVPAVFLLLNLWRFTWVLRYALKLHWSRAIRAMYSFFSLGWIVALADIQGLVKNKGVFLRTPKSKTQSKAAQAIQTTQWETGLGLICALSGLAAFVHQPNLQTAFLGGLLGFQSSLYLAAPALSLVSAYTAKPAFIRALEEGAPILENGAARAAIGLAVVIALIAGAIQFLPQPAQAPSYSQYQPAPVPIQSLLSQNQTPPGLRSKPSKGNSGNPGKGNGGTPGKGGNNGGGKGKGKK